MEEMFWMVSFLWEYPWIVTPIVVIVGIWWLLTIVLWEKRIQQGYFDKQLRPTERVTNYKIAAGAKLYGCFREHFKTTVLWEVPTWAFAILAGALVLAFTIAIGWQATRWIFDPSIGTDPLGISFGQAFAFWVIIGFCVVVGVPFAYHRRRYLQRKTKFFVTNDKLVIYKGSISLAGLIFGTQEEYEILSYTDARFVEEIKIAVDPETLNPRFRTSWLRDQWTKFWAGREDVASMDFPARAFGGRDFVTFMEGAFAFDDLKQKISKETDILNSARGQYYGTAIAARQRVYHDSDKDIFESRRVFEQQMEDAEELLEDYAPSQTIDLFELEPGIWPEGKVIGEKQDREDEVRRRREILLGSSESHDPSKSPESRQPDQEQEYEPPDNNGDTESSANQGPGVLPENDDETPKPPNHRRGGQNPPTNRGKRGGSFLPENDE